MSPHSFSPAWRRVAFQVTPTRIPCYLRVLRWPNTYPFPPQPTPSTLYLNHPRHKFMSHVSFIFNYSQLEWNNSPINSSYTYLEVSTKSMRYVPPTVNFFHSFVFDWCCDRIRWSWKTFARFLYRSCERESVYMNLQRRELLSVLLWYINNNLA